MNFLKMENEWREFAQRHFHDLEGKIPRIQFEETEKTFYATFAHVLIKMRDVIAGFPDDVGVAQLEHFLAEIRTFLELHKNDGKLSIADIPPIKTTPFEPLPLAKADRVAVFDVVDHLRLSFEDLCNASDPELKYMDAFMGVHNFHKLIIQDIAKRSDELSNPRGRAMFYQMAADTFAKAMNELILKERANA